MDYINTQTLTVISYKALKDNNPNVSLPAIGNDIFINDIAYLPVNLSPKPSNVLVEGEGDPVLVDGKYYQTWLTRPFIDSELQQQQEVAAVLHREQLKAERDAAVAAIVVTTSTGKAFNGDETSQTRMARAIVGMQAAGATTIRWVLADNTDTEVTLAELSEALALAGQAQAAIWVLPL